LGEGSIEGSPEEGIMSGRLFFFLVGAAAAIVPPGSGRPPARCSRRAALFAVPALSLPGAAFAAATGGGFSQSSMSTGAGGPPKVGPLAKLTKGEPGPEELQRLVAGYERLQYLLANWEKETTVCIKGCKGSYENCGCIRDPVIVQSYMGYKSMDDPLFKAGDLMLRASSLVESDADFDRCISPPAAPHQMTSDDFR
jgi:hypothetical protein